MRSKTWIIGSSRECDIVVDAPMVSKRHCRLDFDGSAYTLTDLGSTNGTHVNRQRLTGPRIVTEAEQITLGAVQPMPWPSLDDAQDNAKSQGSRVINIGRTSDNEFVINQHNISGRHARLIVQGDTLTIEDLGSTNGTAVGGPENKVTQAVVLPDDRIFFGSTGITVAEILERAKPVAVGSAAPGAPRQGRRRQIAQWAPWLVPLAVVGILLSWYAVGGSWFSSGRAELDGPADAVPTAAKDAAGPNDDRQKVEPGKLAGPESDTSAATSEEDRLSRALYVVVCSDRAETTPFCLGTAFGIDQRRAATSASVIKALQELQSKEFELAWLYNPATKQRISITNSVIHPEYDRLDEVAAEAVQRYDAMVAQHEETPPPLEQIEEIKQSLLKVRLQAVEAMESKANVDVAVIEAEEPLSGWLEGSDYSAKPRPNVKLRVAGLAFDAGDAYFEPDRVKVRTMDGRIRRGNDRLLADATAIQSEIAFIGSPVLDDEGRVVAIYCRPSPPTGVDDSADQPAEQPDQFDAAFFHRVWECGEREQR